MKILNGLVRHGLLLTPEETVWREFQPDGTPDRGARFVNARICFTELGPEEIPEHAESFGPFAFEFELDAMQQLGGTPVIYLRQLSGPPAGCEGVGTSFAVHISALSTLLNTLASLERPRPEWLQTGISCDHGGTVVRFSPDEVATIQRLLQVLRVTSGRDVGYEVYGNVLKSLAGLVYPTENARYTGPLGYYRQREWRIISGMALDGVPLTHPPTPEQVIDLLQVDEDFFGSLIEYVSPPTRRANYCHFYRELRGRHVLTFARRVIAPEAALDRSRSILADLALPVVALESLRG